MRTSFGPQRTTRAPPPLIDRARTLVNFSSPVSGEIHMPELADLTTLPMNVF